MRTWDDRLLCPYRVFGALIRAYLRMEAPHAAEATAALPRLAEEAYTWRVLQAPERRH
jgi:hypothetical protein